MLLVILLLVQFFSVAAVVDVQAIRCSYLQIFPGCLRVGSKIGDRLCDLRNNGRGKQLLRSHENLRCNLPIHQGYEYQDHLLVHQEAKHLVLPLIGGIGAIDAFRRQIALIPGYIVELAEIRSALIIEMRIEIPLGQDLSALQLP